MVLGVGGVLLAALGAQPFLWIVAVCMILLALSGLLSGVCKVV